MDNYWDIYADVYLKEDADLLSEEVDRLLEAIYSNTVNDFEKILYENVRVSIADKITEIFKNEDIEKEAFLRELRGNIDKLKLLKLTISFEPTRSSLIRIAKWAKQNISKYIVIDYIYDNDIIGGTIVEYKGIYKDYSIKKTFNEFMQKEKDEIKKVMDK